MKGTVKFFDPSKGFGFIKDEDGKEYFVHVSALEEGTTLDEDDAVEFESVQGDRGPKASNVKKIDASDVSEEPAEDDAEGEPEEDSSEDSEEEPEDDESDDENKQ